MISLTHLHSRKSATDTAIREANEKTTKSALRIPINRTTTARGSKFDPKDYEETFEVEKVMRKMNKIKNKQQISSAGAVVSELTITSFYSSSSESQSSSPMHSESQSSAEEVGAEHSNQKSDEKTNAETPISEEIKNSEPRGSATSTEGRARGRKQSKGGIRANLDKPSIQIIGEDETENDNDKGEHRVVHETEGNENVGYYEDVDFANQSEDDLERYSSPTDVITVPFSSIKLYQE